MQADPSLDSIFHYLRVILNQPGPQGYRGPQGPPGPPGLSKGDIDKAVKEETAAHYSEFTTRFVSAASAQLGASVRPTSRVFDDAYKRTDGGAVATAWSNTTGAGSLDEAIRTRLGAKRVMLVRYRDIPHLTLVYAIAECEGGVVVAVEMICASPSKLLLLDVTSVAGAIPSTMTVQDVSDVIKVLPHEARAEYARVVLPPPSTAEERGGLNYYAGWLSKNGDVGEEVKATFGKLVELHETTWTWENRESALAEMKEVERIRGSLVALSALQTPNDENGRILRLALLTGGSAATTILERALESLAAAGPADETNFGNTLVCKLSWSPVGADFDLSVMRALLSASGYEMKEGQVWRIDVTTKDDIKAIGERGGPTEGTTIAVYSAVVVDSARRRMRATLLSTSEANSIVLVSVVPVDDDTPQTRWAKFDMASFFRQNRDAARVFFRAFWGVSMYHSYSTDAIRGDYVVPVILGVYPGSEWLGLATNPTEPNCRAHLILTREGARVVAVEFSEQDAYARSSVVGDAAEVDITQEIAGRLKDEAGKQGDNAEVTKLVSILAEAQLDDDTSDTSLTEMRKRLENAIREASATSPSSVATKMTKDAMYVRLKAIREYYAEQAYKHFFRLGAKKEAERARKAISALQPDDKYKAYTYIFLPTELDERFGTSEFGEQYARLGRDVYDSVADWIAVEARHAAKGVSEATQTLPEDLQSTFARMQGLMPIYENIEEVVTGRDEKDIQNEIQKNDEAIKALSGVKGEAKAQMSLRQETLSDEVKYTMQRLLGAISKATAALGHRNNVLQTALDERDAQNNMPRLGLPSDE
jgi:hypothetical protein